MVAYNRTKGDVPEYLKQLLVLNSDMHSRSTRNARLTFLTPRYNRQTEGGRSFAVRTSKCWNSLPFEIRSSTSVNCLKHLLYKFFLVHLVQCLACNFGITFRYIYLVQ